jgi:ABC-type uncharacterized transport system permease subunit
MPSSVIMNILPIAAAVVLYFAAGFTVTWRLFGSASGWTPSRALAIILSFVAAAFHALTLYHGLVTDSGVNLSFFNAVSLVAWVVVMLLSVSAIGKPIENLGIVLLPVAAITILLAWRYPSVHMLPPDSPFGLKIHVLISLLAYSLLTLATLQAILLAIQDYHLRKHHPGGFVRSLPPLQTMESLLFEMISLGFILLTAALISGFHFLEDMFHQNLAHKTILSILAWIAFAVLLWGRYRFGWRGRVAIRWTLIGFATLMLAYFGSKAVLELILHR